MQKKIIAFRDYGNIIYKEITTDDNANVEDKLIEAAKNAESEGKYFTLSDVPDEYLKRHGLAMQPIDIMEIQDRIYGKLPSEKVGIEYASCRHCDAFEDGSCYKYGGICDPDAVEDDCIHAEEIHILTYNTDKMLWNIPLLLNESALNKIDAEKNGGIQWLLEQIMANHDDTGHDIQKILNNDGYHETDSIIPRCKQWGLVIHSNITNPD